MRLFARQLAVTAALAGALAGSAALSACAETGGTTTDGTAGSAGTAGADAEGTSLSGDWQLVAGEDEAGAIGLGHSVVTLSIDGDSWGGNAACNSYELAASGGPGPVEVGGIAQTDLMCVPLHVMETEQRYLSALAHVTAAERVGDQLHLTNDDVDLHFEAWSDDAES